MAPKIGPRGTTIQDVMNVAANGSQPSEPQYVYTPPTQPATTAFDYASLLAGQPAPTYGQKYGGMPTAEYAKAMFIGGAQQARSVGELARLQAEQRNQGFSTYYEPFLANAEKDFDANPINKPRYFLKDPVTSTNPYDPDQVGSTNKNTFGQIVNNYLAAQEAGENFIPAMRRDYNTQVRPYDDLANNILSVPLSEYARQIAVQRYGYDPALAQGLLDQSVDIQALTDQQTLYGLQNPSLSYSPEERIFQQYGQEGLDLYNQQQAQTSLYGTPTEQTALAQQEFAEADTDLYSVYASTPAEVLPRDPNLARNYMADSAFLTEYQAGVTAIAGAGQGLQETKAKEFLLNYYTEVADPVRSQIMENLINNAVSFMGG
jgi:hypothetical protein